MKCLTAKADILAALALIGVSVDNLVVSRDAPDWMHPGRSGSLSLGKMDMGYFGELHPAICRHFDLKSPIVFEFWLDTIPLARNKGPMKPLLNLSAFQPVSRDFAFIVDEQVEAQSLIDLCAKPHVMWSQMFRCLISIREAILRLAKNQLP